MPIITSQRTLALQNTIDEHFRHHQPDSEIGVRAFKGVWINSEIWLDKKLSWFEKCLLAEIDSFDNGPGCFASASHLANMMDSTTGSIRYILSRLRRLGWIKDLPSNDPNRRFIAVCKNGGALVATNGGALVATNTEVLVKRDSKSFQRRTGEREELKKLLDFFTPSERSAYGANWRLRYRECPDKFRRVADEIRVMVAENQKVKSYAAVANHCWNEFAPKTTR